MNMYKKIKETLSLLFINMFLFTNAAPVTSLPFRRCQLRQWILFQHTPEAVQVQLVRERAPVPVPGSGRGGACTLVADSDARLRVQLRRPEHRSVSDTSAPPSHAAVMWDNLLVGAFLI